MPAWAWRDVRPVILLIFFTPTPSHMHAGEAVRRVGQPLMKMRVTQRVHQVLPGVAIAAVLLAWAGTHMHVAADAADVECPGTTTYVAAVQCGSASGSPVVLSCATPAQRTGLCTLPDASLSQALCDAAGATDATPQIFLPLTGAHMH